MLIGGSGTGKTHVATALGVQAVEHHRRKVCFFSTIELVNTLEQEKAKGKAGQLAESLTKLDLVILDEMGCLRWAAGQENGDELIGRAIERVANLRNHAQEPEKTQAVLDHLNLHLAPNGFEVALLGGRAVLRKRGSGAAVVGASGLKLPFQVIRRITTNHSEKV